MARIIELKWNCADCASKGILGRYKECPNCGSPREKGEMRMDGLSSTAGGYNPAASVTDPELLKKANAGADWFCTHCSSGNQGDGDACGSCGAPRYGEEGENHPDPRFSRSHVGRAKKTFAEEVAEEAVQQAAQKEAQQQAQKDAESRKASRERRAERDRLRAAARRRSDEEQDLQDDLRRLSQKRHTTFLFGSIAAGVVALLGIFIWGMSTHLVKGSVTEMTWEHNTHRQTWTQVTDSDWKHLITERSERPPTGGSGERAGAQITSCREKHYEDEKYQCGTREEDYECGSNESYQDTCSRSESYVCGETCSDNGNGFASCSDRMCSRSVSYSCSKTRYVSETCQRTVPKYCTRPIYKPFCKYRTQKWRLVQTETARGKGNGITYWEDIETGPLDRLTRSFEYRVQVEYSDRGEPHRYVEEPPSLNAYKAWKPSEKVTLERRNFGSITKMHHGDVEIDIP
jgi:hypothetical protein